MAQARRRLGFATIALVTVTVLAGCALGREGAVDPLVAPTISPQQHRALAERYREQAADARRLAVYHAALAARYRGPATPAGAGAGAEPPHPDMAAHCRALAEAYDSAAAEYDALAVGHEALAASLAR